MSMAEWNEAITIAEQLKKTFSTMEHVTRQNCVGFTVRGIGFALMRNGTGWDLLSTKAGNEALDFGQVREAISEIVLEIEADNSGWDFDPEKVEL